MAKPTPHWIRIDFTESLDGEWDEAKRGRLRAAIEAKLGNYGCEESDFDEVHEAIDGDKKGLRYVKACISHNKVKDLVRAGKLGLGDAIDCSSYVTEHFRVIDVLGQEGAPPRVV